VAGMNSTVIGLQLDAVYRLMETLEVPKDRHVEIIDKVNLIHSTLFPAKKDGES
jgi:hypothetical protein